MQRPQTLWKQLEPRSPLGWLGALVGLWLAVTVLALILFLSGYVPTRDAWGTLLTGGPGWPTALLSVSLLAAWLLSILHAIRLSGRAVIRALGWWLGKLLLFLTERTGNEVLLRLVPGSRITERELAHHAGIYLPYAGRDPVTLFIRKLRDVLRSLNLMDVVIISAEYRLSAIELRLLADHHEAERLLLFEKRLIAQLGKGGVLRRDGCELLLTVWGIDEMANGPGTMYPGDGRAALVPLCLLPASRLRGPAILHVDLNVLGHTLVVSRERRLAEHLLVGLVLRVRDVYHPHALRVCILGNGEPPSSERQYSYRRSGHLVAISDLGAGIVSLDEVYAELQARQEVASSPERPDMLLILHDASELDWHDERLWALRRAGLSHGIYLLAASTSPERLESSSLNEFTTRLITASPDREQRRRLLDPEGLYRWFRPRDGIEIGTRMLGYQRGKSLPPPFTRCVVPTADVANTLPHVQPTAQEPEVPAQPASQPPEATRPEADEDSVSRPSSPAEQRDTALRVENAQPTSDEIRTDLVGKDGRKTTFPISTPYYVRLFGDFSLERANGEAIKRARRSSHPIELVAYLAARPNLSENKDLLARRIWEVDEERMNQSLTSATNEIKAWFKDAGDSDVTLVKAIGRGPKSPRALDATLIISDVWHFRQAVGYAEDLIEKEPERAMVALREAVDLYRGDFVPGLTRDWAVAVRQQLRGEFIRALQKLIALCEQSGRCQDVDMLRRRLVDSRQRQGTR